MVCSNLGLSKMIINECELGGMLSTSFRPKCSPNVQYRTHLPCKAEEEPNHETRRLVWRFQQVGSMEMRGWGKRGNRGEKGRDDTNGMKQRKYNGGERGMKTRQQERRIRSSPLSLANESVRESISDEFPRVGRGTGRIFQKEIKKKSKKGKSCDGK